MKTNNILSDVNRLTRNGVYSSLLIISTTLQTNPAIAATVSSTTFNGNTFNLMTDSFGNEWLSLLATDGQTFGFVSNQIDGAIGDYASYHFATRTEVVALFTDYGATAFDIGPTNASFAPASALQSDFGSTGAISIGEPVTWGYTSTILVQGANTFPSFHLSPFARVQTSKGEAEFRTTLSIDVSNDANPHLRGSWLIRNTAVSTVPVPAAIWLFGSGLIGLAGIARHRSY